MLDFQQSRPTDDPAPAGEGDTAAGAGATNPLADLLDQVLADLDAGQVARARQTLAAIRRRVAGAPAGD